MTAIVLPMLAALALAGEPAKTDLYGLGMDLRAKGRTEEAYSTFRRMLDEDPHSMGALEGLALTSMSLGRPQEAKEYLLRWNSGIVESSPYLLGLLARADSSLGLEDEYLSDLRALAAAAPEDLRSRRRLDWRLLSEPGAFLDGGSYKSIGIEGLETGNPQRISYEGRSGGMKARARLSRGLDLRTGYSARQEAQRNHTNHFTYFDILEQTASLGLTARPARGLRLDGEYGESFLSDNEGAGVGRRTFSRARVAGEWSRGSTALRITGERSPKFLRGTGGSQYFTLLREVWGSAEAETYRWGWGFFLRGGIDDFSDGVTVRTHSASVLKEYGDHLLRGGFSHGQTEHIGAGEDGRIRFVGSECWSGRYRFLREDSLRLEGGYAYSKLLDGNRLTEADGAAVVWLPWWRELSGEYRFESAAYRGPVDGYRSTDWTRNWLGPHWRRCWGSGLWTHIAWEHALERDSRGAFDANAAVGEAEYYFRDRASLTVSARGLRSTLRDDSFSLRIGGRWTF